MAHMWLQLAAENGLPQAIGNREILAVNMAAADIQRAQELARQPLEIHQKPFKMIENPTRELLR